MKEVPFFWILDKKGPTLEEKTVLEAPHRWEGLRCQGDEHRFIRALLAGPQQRPKPSVGPEMGEEVAGKPHGLQEARPAGLLGQQLVPGQRAAGADHHDRGRTSPGPRQPACPSSEPLPVKQAHSLGIWTQSPGCRWAKAAGRVAGSGADC